MKTFLSGVALFRNERATVSNWKTEPMNGPVKSNAMVDVTTGQIVWRVIYAAVEPEL